MIIPPRYGTWTSAAGLLSLFLLLPLLLAARPAGGKPNIFMVIADDMAWRDCGVCGNDEVLTPNIDRLAAQGMFFSRAFTATAMCSPSRQQLYTGLFPVRNGAYPNHSQVTHGTRSLVHHLHNLGYRVGLIGKRHFGPPDSFPFDYLGADLTPEGISSAAKGYHDRDPNQPWCLIVASRHPHTPWREGHDYQPDRLTIPSYLVDNQETRRALAGYYGEITALDRQVGTCMDALEAADQEDNTIFIFTSEQGPQFPGGKWTCYDLGLRTSLIVRWPSRIRAGSKTEAMVQYVDVVPTLLDAAGSDPADFDTGRPDVYGNRGFDGKSFLPVLLGETQHHHDYVYGVHTTLGIIAGKPYPIRSIRDGRYKYILNLMPEATFQNVVTEEDREEYWDAWKRDAAGSKSAGKLVTRYQHRPAEELYDIAADPFELHNLAGDPSYRGLMDKMKAKLKAWMQQQNDLGIDTELKISP